MVLVDTSVWVEFLRATGSDGDTRLTQLVETGADLVTTEPVIMELLAGAPSDVASRALRSRLLAFPLLRVEGLADYERAAVMWRACRREGKTLRRMTDCLIAAVAIRNDATVLHNDSDFDVLAEVIGLQIAPK